jgi:hypothetical protein
MESESCRVVEDFDGLLLIRCPQNQSEEKNKDIA